MVHPTRHLCHLVLTLIDEVPPLNLNMLLGQLIRLGRDQKVPHVLLSLSRWLHHVILLGLADLPALQEVFLLFCAVGSGSE